jgi:asparagine synthetase B (glutamine-hydrolysing)
MFFVAFTKNRIADKLKSFDFVEHKANSFIATIVTDNFLSKYFQKQNGFSIIESPLISTSYFNDIIFSEVVYNNTESMLCIFKPTISGRPIYYHMSSVGDFFCSTHISLLRKTGVSIEENTNVLPEFFVYRFVTPPATLYKNIKQLSNGSRLHLKLVSGKCEVVHIDQYEPPIPTEKNHTIDNASARTLDFLDSSIQALAPYKDKISVLLSGGIDSSILCRICQDNFGTDTSYSTAYPFEHPNLNTEKRYAISAGKAFGMNHHYYESTSKDYLTGFLDAISLAEEPLHHLQSVCLHSLLKKGIPEDKKIIIQGVGAGGSFGNFRNHLYLKDKILYRLLSTKISRAVLGITSRIVGKGREFVETVNHCASNHLLSDPNNPIWSWHDYGSKKWVCDYFNVTEEDVIEGQYNSINQFEDRSIYDVWSLYSLLGDEHATLSIWTKIGEGNGRILFSPFYDQNTLYHVFSMPWKLKMRRPENILRKEIARRCRIPEFIINRPKSGFGINRRDWAEKDGPFEPLVPLASKAFDQKQIRDMQSSEPKKAMTFWNILNYSIWKRLCINNESLATLLEELDESILRKESFDKVKKEID